MALHRRTKVTPTFNMSSMTDIIFLLLIFFMITSTLVSPNALKVNLPESKKQTTVQGKAYVTIDSLQHIYASADGEDEEEVTLEELGAKLSAQRVDSADMVVSLYADQSVPYKMIVDVLNVANDNEFKMVLATRPPKGSDSTSDDELEVSDDASPVEGSPSNASTTLKGESVSGVSSGNTDQ